VLALAAKGMGADSLLVPLAPLQALMADMQTAPRSKRATGPALVRQIVPAFFPRGLSAVNILRRAMRSGPIWPSRSGGLPHSRKSSHRSV